MQHYFVNPCLITALLARCLEIKKLMFVHLLYASVLIRNPC